MRSNAKYRRLVLLCLGSMTALAGAAQAQITSAADYNHPYGMTQGDENAPVDASLRDSNGNLTLVNGQFTSSSLSQETGLQPMGALGMPTLGASSSTSAGVSTTTLSGGGVGGASMTGTTSASAIGNSLNVITVGNDNTVVVNSRQTNNGNQTATANSSGQ
jgi:holdfast attachment protein HfaA